MRGRLGLAVALAATLVACDASTYGLVVDVRTTLAPGADFDRAVVELYDERGTFGERIRDVDERAVAGDEYTSGRRVAELGDLEPGFYVLRIALMLGANLVVDVTGPVEIRADRAVTVDVSAACVGVMCPPASDPNATVCVAGQCALPECLFSPDTPGCPEPGDAGASDAGTDDGGTDDGGGAGDAGTEVDGGGVTPPAGYVYVPAGPFQMGCNPLLDTLCDMDELPQHEVTVSEFFIMRREISMAEWAACIADAACSIPDDGMYWSPMTTPNDPVVDMTRDEADAYCVWAGGRLPTEAEWEKAARGDDARVYPWGNDPPSCALANYLACGDMRRPVDVHDDVPSPYGAINLAGNVWEWTADFYADDYYAMSPTTDPRGPATGASWPIRGGSYDWPTKTLRASERLEWDHPTAVIGARCVREIP